MTIELKADEIEMLLELLYQAQARKQDAYETGLKLLLATPFTPRDFGVPTIDGLIERLEAENV